MSSDSTFFEVLEADLRALSAEAYKTDSLATQISGWLSHTDYPQLKEASERAAMKLRTITPDKSGIAAVKNSKEILRPFLLVLECKNARLVGQALASVQRLLANNAVSPEGRQAIMQVLQQVEKSNDDVVKLKILQTALTLLQSPSAFDHQDNVGQVLSLCFRTYGQNRNSPTVSSTAAATVRQAVAIVFDHAVAGPAAPAAGGASSPAWASSEVSETSAAALLQDICQMAGGAPPSWLRCPQLPRLFALDLLESVLLHRAAAFHGSEVLANLLNDKVCPQLQSLCQLALHPEVEPASTGECKLILRCVGACLRKHTALLQDAAPVLLEQLLSGCAVSRMVWQRVLSLQVLRWLFADPLLLYALFQQYDMSIHHDLNAVHDTVSVLIDIIKAAFERGRSDEMMTGLNSLYLAKAAGKEAQPDIDVVGPQATNLEIWVLFLAVDCLLLVVADVEAVVDMVVKNKEVDGSEDPVREQLAAAARSLCPVSSDICSNMLDVLWRPVLMGLSTILLRASQESLVLALLKGYQCYIYSAGSLSELTARDGFLSSLCEVAVAPSEEGGRLVERDASLGQVGGAIASAAAVRANVPSGGLDSPGPVSAAAAAAVAAAAAATAAGSPGGTVLRLKNVHALRTLFNVAHRLADTLGQSWVYVVEVLDTLDMVLAGGTETTSSSDPGGANTLPSELFILATAANQLFQASHRMTTDALVSLLSALAQVSAEKLPLGSGNTSSSSSSSTAAGGSTGGSPRFAALNRMVETMLANRLRMQDLWGIFLSHVVELLHSGSSLVRAAAIDALDRTITGTLGGRPDMSTSIAIERTGRGSSSSSFDGSGGGLAQPQAAAVQRGRGLSVLIPPAAAGGDFERSVGGGGPQGADSAGDVEHMMLVALESMYKEEREPDVRQGLLRVLQHVLQRHGDHLTRGWVPLLRLLEAVPSWEESVTISMAFQCVEVVCSDFLVSMPREQLEKTLEIVQLFAAQRVVINISLTSIGLLWNITDALGRSRPPPAAATAGGGSVGNGGFSRAASSRGSVTGLLMGLANTAVVLTRRASGIREEDTSSGGAAAAEAAVGEEGPGTPAAAGGEAGPGGGEGAGSSGQHAAGGEAGRKDLSDAACTELLLKVFTHLRKLSMDSRPEVRNSGVRTLLLAVGSQAGRFDQPTWRYCLWEILFPLITYVHVMGDTSSSTEAASVELGKENGRSVLMLMHHSRNTEQKQWDETTVLALNGMSKVLRVHLGGMMQMQGFADKWDELMSICSKVLTSGRKTVGVAAAQLLTGVLQSLKHSPDPEWLFIWKRTMNATEAAVLVMATPDSPVPLQARTELLTGLSAAYSAQKSTPAFDLEDTEAILRWCNAFARYPLGVDDVTPVPGVLPPVQKLVLQLLGQLSPVALQGTWPSILSTLSGFLCPFKALQQQLAASSSTSSTITTEDSSAAPSASSRSDSYDLPSSVAVPSAAMTVATIVGSTGGGSSSRVGCGGMRLGGIWDSKLSPRSKPVKSMSGTVTAREVVNGPQDSKLLTHLFMSKVIALLVTLWKNFVPYQHRAAKFSEVVASLSECMAMQHLTLEPDLWLPAAAAFCEVAAAGLPAVNICFVNNQTSPTDTWEVLAAAFECCFFGDHIPQMLLAYCQQEMQKQQWQQQQQEQESAGGLGKSARSRRTTYEAAPDDSSRASHAGTNLREDQQQQQRQQPGEKPSKQQEQQQQQPPRRRSKTQKKEEPSSSLSLQEKAEAMLVQVLEVLTDNVLTACASAPIPARARLVGVVARAAALAGTPPDSTSTRTSTSTVASCSSSIAPAGLSNRSGGSGPGASSSSSSTGGLGCAVTLLSGGFKQLAVQKLFQLCGRGCEVQGSNKCHLEVAQLTIIPLMDRCTASLKHYAFLVATQPDIHPDHPATKDANVILEALLKLRLDLSVLEVLASGYPHLPALQAALVHHQSSFAAAARIRRTSSDGSTASNSSRMSPSSALSILQQQQQQGSSGSLTGLGQQQQPAAAGQQLQQQQQPHGCRSHVIVLYEHLVPCIIGGDLQIRQLLERLLLVAGQEMQLVAAG